ncbi:MAG TPA: DUF2141 domain-containing protein [Flavobacteriaceae bacterium]|nr:DUF2141 domain-containing protein [Flavobacteriaceae bacterium]
MKTVAIIIALILTELVSAQQTVTVTVTNVPNDQGKVLFGLYTEGTFIKAVPDYSATSTIENHIAKVVFENIPAGEYAVSCFQDQNSNDKFDFEPNGMPAEPYGISNNAMNMYGPPIWSEAKFSVADKPVNLEIRF